MALIRLACAHCETLFPWIIPREQYVRYSVLEGTVVKCSNCGRQSRITVSLKHALWSWPLTAALLLAVVPFLGTVIGHGVRNLPFMERLRETSPELYGGLGGATGGLIGGTVIGFTLVLGLRRGISIARVDETGIALSRREKAQRRLEALFVIVFLVGIAVACFIIAMNHEMPILLFAAVMIPLVIFNCLFAWLRSRSIRKKVDTS